MPLYRTGIDMFRKYSAKYNGDVVGTRFNEVKDVALERAQSGLITVDTIRELVKPILEEAGITGGAKGTYFAFALKLAKHVLRNKGESAKKIATGLKAYFVNTYDLDPDILDKIVNVIVGWAGIY